MDKIILKKFAIESRQDLMEKISNKIKFLYVDEEFEMEQKGEIYYLSNEKHTLTLTKERYNKRELLIKRIKELGLNQVIEEASYTWFNRIVAIRYMEINDYLPLTSDNQSLGIKVLSSKDNTPDPEILKFTNLTNPDLDIDFKKEEYIKLEKENEKFEYVLLLVCKKLGEVIPQVFDGVTDYIDILMPDNLLNETGFVNKIINEVPTDNFKKVEIIGWLYQYYNQVEKDKVISAKKAYKKNEIPYATQLFTPDWIVKYMVENSLGKYWVEHNGDGALYPSNDLYPSNNLYPSSSITDNWKYFIKDNIQKQEDNLDPTKITFIDPCCGSGHILVYAFEVFYQIYLKAGYNKNEIPELILKNNLFGLDIDDRAGQLSILSVLLKAREYDKRIFDKDIVRNLNIMSIQELKKVNDTITSSFTDESKELLKYLEEIFENAKEIGSLLIVENKDYKPLEKDIEEDSSIFGIELKKILCPIIKQAKILSKKYDIVVTNPPYMNSSVMSNTLKKYISDNYKEVKSDLFSAFIIRNSIFSKENSYLGFMTPYVWMFISSYEYLREYIINNISINSLIQLEYSALEEATVPICTFVLKNNKTENNVGTYFKLSEFTGGMKVQEMKYLEILNNKEDKNKFIKNSKDFSQIPGSPIAYWLSKKMLGAFEKGKPLKEFGDTRQGMATSDVNRFTRLWYEVSFDTIGYNYNNLSDTLNGRHKWFPYIKGGKFRKWSGNYDSLVNWEYDGKEVKNYAAKLYQSYTRTIKNISYYLRECISWGMITSKDISIRYYPKGFIFDIAGCCLFSNHNNLIYLLAFLNTKISRELTKVMNPTINMNVGDVANLPIIYNSEYKEILNNLVENNIQLSKQDWDSFETSWDFKKHPLVNLGISLFNVETKEKEELIENNFNYWNNICEDKFMTLKRNEEELNRIFIDIYGLQDELTPEVEDKDITIRKADKLRDIKSLISYAVGCMFGRYSLDEEGLIYAGGEFDSSKYKSFKVDNDNIIPITDEAYFGDDVVTRFKTFISIAFGKDTLNENLDYIAETLGKRNLETSEETIRRYFNDEFYNDHIKIYQKRPIYWQFDSGKKNGFKCLIYMHRYNEIVIPKIRLDYLHRMQNTYETIINDINEKLRNEVSLNEKKELEKRLAELSNKLQETKEYDEKIAHLANRRINIDLDDGVVENYVKLQDVLTKIK